jgi:hydroxymethylpyrimidine/phosphomethylpyrimidine kinase
MSRSTQACLTIAGSDPSGGAGIQADLKTFNTLGVYGCAVITCLTAQNSHRVSSYQPVASEFIQQQIELVLEDLLISHIKIGMVGSSEAAVAIGQTLASFKGEIIYDPVMKASDGSDLLNQGALPIIIEQVIANATVITPNLPELQTITQHPCSNPKEATQAAADLLGKFPNLKAIILTGGHFPAESDQITDYMVISGAPSQKPEVIHHGHKRIKTSNTHGTGCTFSSAFTAFHLQYGNLQKAFFESVDFVDQIMRKSSPFQGGLQHHLFQPATS